MIVTRLAFKIAGRQKRCVVEITRFPRRPLLSNRPSIWASCLICVCAVSYTCTAEISQYGYPSLAHSTCIYVWGRSGRSMIVCRWSRSIGPIHRDFSRFVSVITCQLCSQVVYGCTTRLRPHASSTRQVFQYFETFICQSVRDVRIEICEFPI